MKDVRDRIWITSKVRMISERRYLSYESTAHLLMNTFSGILLLTSIYPDEIGRSVPGLSKINVAFSLLIFGSSLLVYGFKFGETAAKHRECYLKLQRLLDSNKDDEDNFEKYHDILENYPNQSDRDYYDFVFERYRKRKEPILRPGTDVEIVPSFWVCASYLCRKFLFFIFCRAMPVIFIVAIISTLLVEY
ncbi:SLATT domain-containing protein [Azospirillum cavernae]|uniref:SLATT domain-containing protein n=1 Tax=Azospirillum cavernae TaxID=2320860 RepID=A0A418VS62_9PROT|nr:SLATT domain-containing protein [Azospirillum cavernae]RJF79327.1 SLATT domain-containing protein [Azospirillum cavernae]